MDLPGAGPRWPTSYHSLSKEPSTRAQGIADICRSDEPCIKERIAQHHDARGRNNEPGIIESFSLFSR